MLEFENTKTFLLKDTLQIGSKEVSIVNKIKNTGPWTYVINDLNSELITGSFYEKEMERTSQKNSEQKKLLKEKVIKCMSNGKDMIIHLIVGLIMERV